MDVATGSRVYRNQGVLFLSAATVGERMWLSVRGKVPNSQVTALGDTVLLPNPQREHHPPG
jgi:hypothetical protein